NSRDAYTRLGWLHLVSGQPRAAAQYFASAAVLDPLDDYLQAQRCFALQDMGQFEEATTACDTARALAPASPSAYTVTSPLADGQGRLDQALRWNAEALKRGPDDVDLYKERGRWQLALGLPQAAHATYMAARTALAGDLDSLDALTELGFLTVWATDGA